MARIREVVEGNRRIPHMIEILEAARSAGVRVFFAPHHRWRTGDYETWKFWAPIQEAGKRSKVRWDEMKATLEISAPNYARSILSTKDLIASIHKIGA